MAKAKLELRAECVRLRVAERLSLREIHLQTGASKGSLSTWLRPYPLTDAEKAERAAKHPGKPPKDRGTKSKYAMMADGFSYSTLQRAKIAEAAVLYRLVIHGMNPFGSVFDGDKTDWLVEVPGQHKAVRIQVKTATQGATGLPAIRLRCANGYRQTTRPYQEGEFDFIVGHDLFTDTCHVWAWSEVEGMTSCVSICPETAERWDKITGS